MAKEHSAIIKTILSVNMKNPLYKKTPYVPNHWKQLEKTENKSAKIVKFRISGLFKISIFLNAVHKIPTSSIA